MTPAAPAGEDSLVQIFGHHHAQQRLCAALNKRRCAQALMISGRKGLGKATLGQALAFHLLAGAPGHHAPGHHAPTACVKDLSFSSHHPTAHLLRAGSHPDFCLLAPEVDTKTQRPRPHILIEAVHKSLVFMQQTSRFGGHRVLLIDPLEALRPAAANALLKLLEEPPLAVVIILISHNPCAVLATLRSRCQQLRLSPLADEELRAFLMHRFPEEHKLHAQIITRAQGSPGRATELGDGQEISLAQALGSLLKDLPQLDRRACLDFAAQLDKNQGQAFAAGGRALCDILRRIIVYLAGGTPVLSADEAALCARLPKNLAPWLAVAQELDRLLPQVPLFGLDRNQVMIAALEAVAAAAGASPSS